MNYYGIALLVYILIQFIGESITDCRREGFKAENLIGSIIRHLIMTYLIFQI
jgi:hypothetical protein